jgi:hypothetical protein
MKKIAQIVIISFILIAPYSFNNNNNVFAEHVSGQGATSTQTSTTSTANQNNGSSVPVQLVNPLAPKGDPEGGIRDIPTFVEKILEVVMKIGVPIVAIAIIYTGYLFIAAQGNEKKLEEAKQAIVWVFVGAVILLGAYVIAQALQGTMDAIRGVS